MTRATRSEWAERVRRWAESGETAREFATREGINARTLRWWASELRRSARSSSKFIDVTAVVAPAQNAPGFELVIRDSVRVRVSPGFDAQLLRAVVAALEPR